MLDYLRDLECDFLALYGVVDMYDLPAPTFFAMATRASAFQGVMGARMAAREIDKQKEGEVREIPSDRSILQHELGDVMEVAHG